MELSDHLRAMLKELGQAINESISGSGRVHDSIQKIRDEGYNLYVVLDATIGLDKGEDSASETLVQQNDQRLLASPAREDVKFRIDITDLGFLRSIGIDPTRKVRTPKRLEGRTTNNEPS